MSATVIPVSRIPVERLVHKLNSPLGAVHLWAEELAGPCVESRRLQLAEQLLREVRSLSAILRRAAFADQGKSVRWTDVRIGAVVSQAVATAVVDRPELPEPSVLAVGGPHWVRGDAPLLAQMIEQLVRNAMESDAQRVDVVVRSDLVEVDVQVIDDGVGLPPTERAAIWEPFFSTKAGHAGLGLSLAARVADIHGAVVTLTARRPSGVRAGVRLPVARAGREKR